MLPRLFPTCIVLTFTAQEYVSAGVLEIFTTFDNFYNKEGEKGREGTLAYCYKCLLNGACAVCCAHMFTKSHINSMNMCCTLSMWYRAFLLWETVGNRTKSLFLWWGHVVSCHALFTVLHVGIDEMPRFLPDLGLPHFCIL